MRKGYYQADVDGVAFYDTVLDDPEADVMSPWGFYDHLPVVDDEEVVITFMDENDTEAFQAIKNEYGIRGEA